jgi:hypothetical protein
MIDLDIFLAGVMIASTLTGLATEAIKKIFAEHNVAYRANTIAGIVAFILAAALGSGYVVMTGMEFTAKIVVCIVALVFMSWLCAMVGYDKVVGQFKNTNKEE